MSEKQIKLLEWLKKLELYAQNENLPMRLADSIRDLQKQVVEENADWHQLCINADNLLQSIGEKIRKQQVSQEIVTDFDAAIPVEEVRKKISEALERGHNENNASISSALYGSNAPIKYCYQQIDEIVGNKETVHKICKGDYFLNLFNNVKQNYEQNITHTLNNFATSISNNCMRMIENIRSICKSISGYKLGVGEEKFYIKYNERKEGWDNQLRYNIANADLGAHVIMDFAQATLEKIRKITPKYEKKKKVYLALPCIVMLIGLLIVGAFSLVQSAKNDDSGNEITIKRGETEITVDVSGLSSSINGGVTSNIKIVIIIIAVYAVYAAAVLIIYHNKLLSDYGECLRRESELFEKENRLDCYVKFGKIVADYEKYYLDVVNEIFEGTTLDYYSAKQQNEYEQFCNELNSIQKM
ncbi:MAG: hypothetical protein NC313_16050 [Butyrivibrio sp.]|nr:hypothetical protein [Butyrivibrio sp.]